MASGSSKGRITAWGVGRTVLATFFALLGFSMLSSVAPTVLVFLFSQITRIAGTRDASPPPGFNETASVLPFGVLGAIVGGFLGVRLWNLVMGQVDRWDRMEVGDKVNIFLGALTGLVGSVPFLVLLQNLEIPTTSKAMVITVVVVGLTALSIYMLQSMAEVLPWSRMRGKSRRSGIKLLDTNVIIDGRVSDVAKAGFLEGEVYVPGFVLDELQLIADSHDALKRQRGRRGLEVLKQLQADFPLEVRIHDKLAPEMNDGVDSRLVRLAKAIGADIVTNDFNLNRVAALQGIRVLNLNDLSLALRPNVLPSEMLELTVLREGKEPGQGVGYLEDGTMVVVENGRNHLGETLDVTVKQVIQTERGKMIFAEVGGLHEDRPDPKRKPRPRNAP